MASGRILNFYSTHQKSTIHNTARCFVYNMFNLSDESFMSDMQRKAEHILKLNNFPEMIADKIIKEAMQKWRLERNCQVMYGGTLFVNDFDAFELLEPGHGTQKLRHDARKPLRRYAALPYYPEITPMLQGEIRKFDKSHQSNNKTHFQHRQRKPAGSIDVCSASWPPMHLRTDFAFCFHETSGRFEALIKMRTRSGC